MTKKIDVFSSARWRIVVAVFLELLVLFGVFRVLLYFYFVEAGLRSVRTLGAALLTGIRYDLLILFWVLAPLCFWFVLLPEKWLRSRWHRYGFNIGMFIAHFNVLFLLVVEYFYFAEFNGRFDYIAVNYLIYPREVFVNIWESYPLIAIVAACLIVSGAMTWLFRKAVAWSFSCPRRKRERRLLLAVWVLSGVVATLTVTHNNSNISPDRVTNQVALNGWYGFFYAGLTNQLDYPQYYLTIAPDEAARRVKARLADKSDVWQPHSHPLLRDVPGQAQPKKRNVIIIAEESMGSEFMARLNPDLKKNWTPELEKIAQQSVLFTNFYATGNRTARGLEAITSGFAPIPGESVLKRSKNKNFFTLARVLKKKKYDTVFLYGGRGLFDGMRSYMLANGFDRFIEEKDFENPVFTTAWGVSDEDILNRALTEFDALAKKDKPFFGMIMSVSNHRPFTYPAGRVSYDPAKKDRHQAVAYADWTLGDFFTKLKQRPYYRNTILVILGDHGARVYGSEAVPIRSYEIPLVIHNPDLFPTGQEMPVIGSQNDVAPTILGLLGLPYRSVFLGRDLFRVPVNQGFALLSHNRDVALFDGRKMAVLGCPKTVTFFDYDTKTRTLARQEFTDEFANIRQDAISFYQLSSDLFKREQYNIPE